MPTPHEGRIPPGRATGRAGAQTNTAPTGSDTGLVAALTLHEKVLLLTGADSWSTQGAELLGLRPMIMSDGPAGARGVTLDERHPSTSLPCPSALGATWDPELVRELAAALGAEARGKGIDVLLGPTINLMRSPLGGRGFECFAEDPVLTARIAVSYVRGLQGAGVAATLKHYVCNDTETQRWSYDARIAENVLRELYLMPFEACVKEADAALVMAAYNMVNGTPMTENAAAAERRAERRVGIRWRGHLGLACRQKHDGDRAGNARPVDARARWPLGRAAGAGRRRRRRHRGRPRRQDRPAARAWPGESAPWTAPAFRTQIRCMAAANWTVLRPRPSGRN